MFPPPAPRSEVCVRSVPLPSTRWRFEIARPRRFGKSQPYTYFVRFRQQNLTNGTEENLLFWDV